MAVTEKNPPLSGTDKEESGKHRTRDDSGERKLRWRCRSYRELHQMEWEEEYFVFNPDSGDTHLLNPLSMEILRLLSREELNLKQVMKGLQSLTGEGEPPLPRAILKQHLIQLDLMGLISPVDHDSRPA